jgi:hypothetical protein
MWIFAEISDKMPSTAGIIEIAVIAGVICGGIALANRIVAWSMLGITLSVGFLLAYDAFGEAFFRGPMRGAVWSEMGWPWALAYIIGPLLPAVGVAGVLLFRRWPTQARGFPIDGPMAG